MMSNEILRAVLKPAGAVALCAMALGAGAPAYGADKSEPTFEVLDPRGEVPAIKRIPLAGRLGGFDGARIAIVKSWDDNSGFDETIGEIATDLRSRGAAVTVMDRNTLYSSD